MKSTVFILILISTLGFSQNPDFKPTNKEFSIEFMRLVDSTRASIHGTHEITTLDPESKEWVTLYPEYNTKLDSSAVRACEHHNSYLYQVVKGEDRKPIILGHTEGETLLGFKYKGNAPLLNNHQDRCNYYGNTFRAKGECVWGGYTTHSAYRDMNSIDLAKEAFRVFMNSKVGHREILINEHYTEAGIKLTIDPENKRFYIAYITGYTKKAKN
jgi:hypothetical protein